MNTDSTAEKTVVGCLTLLLMPLSLFTYAWVTSKMWVWFITPAFGVAVPSLAILAGFWIIQTLFQRPDWMAYDVAQEDSATKNFSRFLAGAFFQPLLALGYAWLIVALFI